ncbi:peptidyl-prolyl cis-trans isomerase FKBP53 [Tanacetum coccineum]
MAFWGVKIKPGKPHVHQFDDELGRLHVSQATLGATKSKEKAIVVVNVGDKKPIFLCSLLPRKMETCSINIEFEEYDVVTFSVEGPHSVHLSGFYYGEKPDSEYEEDESDSEDGSFDAAEIDSGDDSDFSFVDEDDLTDSEMDMLPSRVPNSGVKIEEIVDDEKPDELPVTEQSKKKNKQGSDNDDGSQKQTVLKSSDSVPVLESEDEDGFPISSTANEKGKRKKEVDESDKSAKRKKDDSVTTDLSSQPVKVEEPTSEKKSKKKKNKKAKDAAEGGNNDINGAAKKEQANQEQTPDTVSAKKKNKQQENTSGGKSSEAKPAKPSQVRTFPNGLVIEELQMGKPNGKRADKGKKISMRYIGKLKKNGKIFDSNIGKAPFKFRLGVGQVIAGWDVGVKGMRVGDKRRLTIPPAMGYGARGAGSDIPPNAWLEFEVELVDVN